MTPNEIFENSTRSTGDMAGVFEYDGETGYFYLYNLGANEGERVVDAIHILSGQPDFTQADVAVRWDRSEKKVGLFIRGVLWAAFDGGRKIGGNYTPGRRPTLPPPAAAGFDT